MMKDYDGDKDSDSKAPYCPLEPGLDPKIKYNQKFVYPAKKDMPHNKNDM